MFPNLPYTTSVAIVQSTEKIGLDGDLENDEKIGNVQFLLPIHSNARVQASNNSMA